MIKGSAARMPIKGFVFSNPQYYAMIYGGSEDLTHLMRGKLNIRLDGQPCQRLLYRLSLYSYSPDWLKTLANSCLV